MLGLGLPERAGRLDLGDDLARPQAGGLDVGDRVLGDAALLVVGVVDRRAVAQRRRRCPGGSASSGRGSGRRTRAGRGTTSARGRRRSRSPRRACRGCGRSRSGRRRRCSRPASRSRRAACGSGPASPRSTHRRGSPSRPNRSLRHLLNIRLHSQSTVPSALRPAAQARRQQPHAEPVQMRHEPVDHDRHGDRCEHEGAEHGRHRFGASLRAPG